MGVTEIPRDWEKAIVAMIIIAKPIAIIDTGVSALVRKFKIGPPSSFVPKIRTRGRRLHEFCSCSQLEEPVSWCGAAFV